jgi:hypothetical protein
MTENLLYIIIVIVLIKQQLYFLCSGTAEICRRIRKVSTHTIKGSTCTLIITDKLQEEEERYSCWCLIVIDGKSFEAKIIHKGRGKFKILNDEYGGKYTNKVVDASDVIRCIIEI